MAESEKSLWEQTSQRIAASRPGGFFFVHIAPHIDRRLMPLTRGRLTMGGLGRVGMLNVRGAKTGAERQTPLVYTRDGDNLLLVASRGGDTKHPAWYRNVVANPDVSFSIGGDERPYIAHVATGEERPRVWDLVTSNLLSYEIYQRRAEREIPVIVLEPRDGEPEADSP